MSILESDKVSRAELTVLQTEAPANQLRVLVVTDSAGASASSIKRGEYYRPLFTSLPGLQVEYLDRRRKPVMPLPATRTLVSRVRSRIGRALAAPASSAAPTIHDILSAAATADVVYLLKVPDPELLNAMLSLGGPKLVLDINDGLWLPYHRAAGWRYLESMLEQADGVVVENDYVAEYVRRYARNVWLVPDCAQLALFDRWRHTVQRDQSRVRLGWIGGRSTASSMYSIWEVLEDLFDAHPQLELRVLGATLADLPRFEKVRCTVVPSYGPEEMAREALTMDIGLFPQFRVEESRARGNGKAMVYMAAGVPAMCENIGEVAALIVDGRTGMLAANPHEWRDKLERLIVDAEERQRIGAAGLAAVRELRSDEQCFKMLVDALTEARTLPRSEL